MTESRATTSGVSIDRANAEDMPIIQSLLAESRLPALDSNENPMHFYVARWMEIVIGCLGCETYDTTALLRSFVVSKGFRGAGVGSLILEEALKNLADNGTEEFYLLTEGALGFAERFGFKQRERDLAPQALQASRQFSSQCGATANCLWLDAQHIPQH